jgi:hypothetical protein
MQSSHFMMFATAFLLAGCSPGPSAKAKKAVAAEFEHPESVQFLDVTEVNQFLVCGYAYPGGMAPYYRFVYVNGGAMTERDLGADAIVGLWKQLGCPKK